MSDRTVRATPRGPLPNADGSLDPFGDRHTFAWRDFIHELTMMAYVCLARQIPGVREDDVNMVISHIDDKDRTHQFKVICGKRSWTYRTVNYWHCLALANIREKGALCNSQIVEANDFRQTFREWLETIQV